MDKSHRPAKIQVKGSGDDGDPALERESSLLPGMVRTPSRLFGLGVDADWAAPGSTIWEEVGEQVKPKATQTPLTGYGRSSEAWASATGSPLLNDGDPSAAAAFDSVEGGAVPESVVAEPASEEARAAEAAALAAAALQAISSEVPPSNLPVAMRFTAPFTTNATRAATTAHTAVSHHRGVVHQPYAIQPNLFSMREGAGAPGQPTQQPQGMTGGAVADAGVTVLEHHGHGSRGPQQQQYGGGGGVRTSLDDKDVAQSIIVSAGLPLSMTSLVEYIREGQPHFEDATSGQDAAIYGTTTNARRNYPNLSEPPPGAEQQQQPYGSRGDAGGAGVGAQRGAYTASSLPPQPPSGFAGGVPSGTANGGDNWMGVAEGSSTGGGWNVQANSPSMEPANPPQPYTAMGPYRSADVATTVGFSLPPSASSGFGQLPQQPQQQQHQDPYRSSVPHVVPHGAYPGHMSKPKSESEILSDLLHFHANFFPPPPPPRVPHGQKRSRAALWYHYAAKWDITHRLPPPPRNPLPEMELEYVMGLPEMTRVPYHGDGWLEMSERWFAVTQSLFDFPEENTGVELDPAVVFEQVAMDSQLW